MEQINLREIPNYFDYENTVKGEGKVDIAKLTEFLISKGNIEDKVRLLCICALCRDRESGRGGGV